MVNQCGQFDHIDFLWILTLSQIANWKCRGKSTGHFDQLILGLPFSLHGFPAPFRRRFPALPLGGHRRVFHADGHSVLKVRCWFGNKKSPHNNLNLTIPSGMALVRVCYVAIRKLKTCSGSFRSRAGTLSKYVILNCWNRLPQESSYVNKKIWKYATFGGLQEKAVKTLAKRERAGWCQPPCGS